MFKGCPFIPKYIHIYFKLKLFKHRKQYKLYTILLLFYCRSILKKYKCMLVFHSQKKQLQYVRMNFRIKITKYT